MPDLKHLHILLVEDDIHTRNMLRYMLQTIGIKMISEAGNGAEGLHFMEHCVRKINVILCDWNMPCMTGIDMLENIRQHDQDLPFLMISGKQDLASITRAKNAGVSAYLHKPLNPLQLQEKLAIVTRVV
jgi:CheY-like chemotaxis protein